MSAPASERTLTVTRVSLLRKLIPREVYLVALVGCEGSDPIVLRTEPVRGVRTGNPVTEPIILAETPGSWCAARIQVWDSDDDYRSAAPRIERLRDVMRGAIAHGPANAAGFFAATASAAAAASAFMRGQKDDLLADIELRVDWDGEGAMRVNGDPWTNVVSSAAVQIQLSDVPAPVPDDDPHQVMSFVAPTRWAQVQVGMWVRGTSGDLHGKVASVDDGVMETTSGERFARLSDFQVQPELPPPLVERVGDLAYVTDGVQPQPIGEVAPALDAEE